MSEYGYGPLPGVGARDPEPVDAEAEDDDELFCDWCGVLVWAGETDYPPYCSEDCEQAATRETFASIHPRPEDVG